MAFLQRDPGCRFRPAATGGFTLVELLVVIGIIAILGGIMLPVISRALDQGKLAACQSNVRRLGEQLLLITTDGPPGFEPGFLVPYFTNVSGSYYWFGAIANSLDPGQDISVDTLVESKPRYFLCPKAGHTHEGSGISGWGETAGWSSADLSFGYVGTISPPDYLRMSTVSNPSATGLLGDSDADLNYDSRIFFTTSDTSTPPSNSKNLPGRRHRGGGNVLSMDGHVNWQSIEDLMSVDGPFRGRLM